MIYTCALPDSDSCAASSWYQRMRAADDDDGNLANGTPHAAALFAAFDRHNIACGLATDPENQSTTSCPSLETPALSLAESEAGTLLDWEAVAGAAEYLVFRGEMGCGRQLVPIATLSAGETSYLDTVGDFGVQRFYRVQAVGANNVCGSPVSSCETGSAGPRLQQQGHRVVEEGGNVNLNGRLDPGETVKIPVTLLNGGTGEAVGVSGRLRTVDPGAGRVIDPLATWPGMLPGEELESDEPHFELTLFGQGISCGQVAELEIEMSAAGAAKRTARFSIPLGTPGRDYLKEDGQVIPRQTFTPVISTLEVTDAKTIGELDVSVGISHPGIDELIVELSSPEGTTVRLHDNSGSGSGLYTRYDLESDPDGPGTMADFEGERLAGTWTLSVQDTVYGAFGQAFLNEWTLHATAVEGYDCEPLVCGEPAPTEAPAGLLVDATKHGDGTVDLHFSWGGVAGAAGYHLLHSADPAYGQAVDLTGRTDGATTLTVPDGGAQTPPTAFFQARAVNGCNEESP
jgi:subtilisin-like proprotein convertase family protein